MIIKNVVKSKPTDTPQIELSGVKDGERYSFQALQAAYQQAANPVQGVSYANGIIVEPVVEAAAEQ